MRTSKRAPKTAGRKMISISFEKLILTELHRRSEAHGISISAIVNMLLAEQFHLPCTGNKEYIASRLKDPRFGRDLEFR